MRSALRWIGVPLLALAGCLCLAIALAQGAATDLAAIPPLSQRVTDVTATLSAAQHEQLEQQLAAFEAAHGSQIAILMVASTQPETIDQYAIRVAEAWKIGRKAHDDGVLITVAKNDHKLRIDVGYGLEGAIPDAIAKRIISETISPRLRAGDFAGGLAAGVTQIQTLIEGEHLPAPTRSELAHGGRGAEGGTEQWLVLALMIAVVGGGILRVLLGRLLGSGVSASLVAAAAWFITGSLLIALIGAAIAFVFVLSVSAGARRGGWGSGGWGGGGSWGGGSSGWGGGGGSFGGGGASGDW